MPPRPRLIVAIAMLLAGLLPGDSAAQATYRLTGDTLRYRERSSTELVITTPEGPSPARMSHASLVALRGAGPDSAQGWYEELEMELRGLGPAQRPATDGMLRKPFALRVSPRGGVITRRAPTVPPDIVMLGDLSHQFADFLISLPAGALTAGTTWTDTVQMTRPSPPMDRYRGRAVRRFRVARDTVIDGESAVIVAVEETISLETSGLLGPQRVRTTARMAGREWGDAVFSPGRGQLLSRARRGELRGTFEVSGGAMPVKWPQTISYRSSLDLER